MKPKMIFSDKEKLPDRQAIFHYFMPNEGYIV